MTRGTTPTHIFNLPILTSVIKELRITYAQMGRTILDKRLEDVRLEESSIRLTLTQDETLKFAQTCPAICQIKLLTNDGAVLASGMQDIHIDGVLNEEVLG